MTAATGSKRQRSLVGAGLILAVGLALVVPGVAQSGGSQSPSQPPANSQPAQEIPDAPSTVQPPPPRLPAAMPPGEGQKSDPNAPAASEPARLPASEEQPAPPPMAPVQTIPPGSGPRNQVSPTDDLYKISIQTNFVQIPVMVKDSGGRRVDGLLPKDFVVLENGKPQKLTFFTSDPFQLSVAIVLDTGMADVALQKVNQTFGALVSAFSPYDEFALYTYSSTVTQVTGFTGRAEKLTASLDQMKLVRGHANGAPVLGGPLGPEPPMVNGIPVGSSGPPPVYTPAKEAHVLNDAILRAALDLSKRDRTRRKVILVVSDGREQGSQASYKDVLRLLETHGIQVKAVVTDAGALPGYKQVEKLHHLFRQGYSDILPKYTNATGGGEVFSELSRNAIEDAYTEITSEARNQYTLGYSPQAIKGSAAFRPIEVVVSGHGKNLNIYAKRGYYPIPSAH